MVYQQSSSRRSHRSKPSHQSAKKRPTTNRIPSPTKQVQMMAIAGTTATLATAGALQAFKTAPVYEGYIQLVGILPTSVPPMDNSAQTALSSELTAELANANIAPPSLIDAVQPSMINNPQMAGVVAHQLQQKGIALNSRDVLAQVQAKTSPEGWLELHYQNTNPEHVHQVLEHIAQWYVAQDTHCDIQACQDIAFIESQISILQQQREQLKWAIATLHPATQQRHPTTQQPSNGSVQGNVLSITDQVEQLSGQVRDQAQQLAQIEDTMTDARTRLHYLQAEMNLGHVEIHTGFALLHQALPHYQTWLASWQHNDAQLIAASLHVDPRADSEIDPGIDSQIGSQVGSASVSQRSTEIEAIASQQRDLLAQMNTVVGGLVNQSLVDMPPVIRDLILADVKRVEPISNWLQTLHTLQLLERRRQNLTQLHGDLVAQRQQWERLHQTQKQLQRDLAVATESLTAYQDRYTIAQYQVAQQELTWQLIKPPQVVQHTRRLWSFANLLPDRTQLSGEAERPDEARLPDRANPLITIQTHLK
ncbi:MAG: hypothetical protein F6K09_10215 [Merismopedia sp. SIO2A8]|nr:hypothetical protein [Merismopedia sp. SIO2A8]